MKSSRLLLLLLFALLVPWAATAQTTVEIGDGTNTTNANPIGTYYNYSITEQLYTAEEIGMAGTISSISFYYAGTAAKDFPIAVYMMNVDADDLSTGISLEGAEQVFDGTLSVVDAGWATINLDSPFAYDGSSNLLIGVNKDFVNWYSGGTWYSTSVTSMARYSQNDNSAYDLSTTPGTTNSNRPNIQMEITAGGGAVCEKPETMEIADLTSTLAVINWTGGSGTYNIEYKKASETEWIVRDQNYGPDYYGIAFVNLEPNTTYNVRVQSVCTDGVSGWKTINFTTLAGIPLVENFDASGTPTGWTKYTGLLANVMAGEALTTTTSGWSITNSNGVFDNHARVNIYGSTCKYWLVTPSLMMEEDVQLLFDMALTAYSGTVVEPNTTGTDDKFAVLITTDGGTTWEVLRQWDNAGSEYVYNDIACSATGETVAIDLSAYARQSIAIAFYGESTESNADNNLHIDNVSINYVPNCAKPETLTLNGEPHAHDVTLAWTGGSGLYNIEYKKASDDEWRLRWANYQGLGIMLVELDPETNYQARVQSVCEGGFLSEWKTVSFTTTVACIAPSDLTVTLIPGDATAATLAWTENGTATEWDVEYGTDAAFENFQIVNASGIPSITLQNLTPETTYYARVKAYCGDEGYSSYSNSVSFQPTEKLVIGSGTGTNNYLPTYPYYNYSYTQQIYTAAELGEAGLIESIDFYTANSTVTRTLDIYMVSTNKDSFESTSDWVSVTEADLMFSGEVTFTAGEWTTIALEGFVYDGVNNVVLVVDDNTGTYVSAPGFRAFTTETAQSIYVYSDGTNYDPFEPATASSTTTAKNQVRLVKSELTGCLKPTALTVNYTGGLTADVSWTSDAPAWNMRVNGHNVPGTITNPFTLIRLQLATTYTVEVQAVCEDGSTSEWASISFTTDLCMPEDMCELTYVLNDSFGDGWNGNAIQVVDPETEEVLATWTLTTGSSETGTLAICEGRYVEFVWVKGSYPGEASWAIYDVNGEEITSGTGNSEMVTGDIITNYTMNCAITTCRRPTDLAVSEIGPHSAMLSWTENGEATEWVVEYTDVIAGAVYTIETTTNPYTMVGLFPESDYLVRVRPVCSDFDDKWSEEIRLVTDVACPAPTNLNATNIMANKATLTWEGFSNQYIVRYAAVAHGEVFAEQNFDDYSMGEWTTIDADGDGYDWVLGSECGGIYLVEGGSLADAGHNASADLVTSGSYSNYTNSALTPDNYLVSPQVTLGGIITFWACGQDASYVAEHFGVAVSTTGNTDPADFTTIWESTMTAKGRANANGTSVSGNMTRGGNRDQGTWYQYTVDLSDYSGEGYVAIRHFNCTDMFLLNVDDIVIEGASQTNWIERPVRNNTINISNLQPETEYAWQVQAVCGGDDGSSVWTNLANFTTGSFCDAPVQLEATNITFEAATLNWIGNQRKFNVRYRADEEWIEVNNTTVPLTITGLIPETQYEWQVQGIYRGCGENNATEWSEVSYFMTESIPTQTVALLRGANWFSTNLVITLDDLKNALVTALPNKKIAIAAQDGTSLTYNRGRWTGDLESLDVTQMYIIQVAANCEITLYGPAIIPAEHPITLNKGWNWIGYPGSESMSVEEALAGFRARNNDVIKGRTSFTKFTNGEWQGTLTAFEPGQGYQFGSGSARPRILVFQTGVRGDVIIDNNTPNFFQPVNEYANNMTMTAVVELNGEELRSEDYELAAFVGDECRGSVKLMYVESIDRYVAFLTVLGDQQEELYFQLTDGFESNMSSNGFTYAIDDVTGTLDEPYIVQFRPTDVEENASANVKIYPNPSQGIFNIEGSNIRKVEVFNTFGQSVYSKETKNEFMSIDLTNHASGIYMIRIISDSGVYSHQIIKR